MTGPGALPLRLHERGVRERITIANSLDQCIYCPQFGACQEPSAKVGSRQAILKIEQCTP